jgi:penicillin amidase
VPLSHRRLDRLEVRGPVVDVDRGTAEAISLRTPARVEADLGFEALLPLLRPTTVDDVAAALTAWVEPANSVLVADSTGSVRRLVAGLVPVRDARCRQVPVPASDPRYRWRDGYAPLPSAPVPDAAVNANDRRAGDTAALGEDFAPPHRARRIRARLGEGDDPATIHRDDRLDAAVLREVLAGLSGIDGPAAALRDRLLRWDGRMRADSTDAGAFAAWRAAFARRLCEHPVLRPLSTGTAPGVSDACWRGPVARYVWDLADRSASRWVVPFGASGDPGSPHFADQLPLWAAGELIPIETDWSRLTGPLDLTTGERDPRDRRSIDTVTARSSG